MYGYILACIVTALTVIIQQFILIPLHILLLVLFVPYFLLFNILFYLAITNPIVLKLPWGKQTGITSTLNAIELSDCAKRIEAHLLFV